MPQVNALTGTVSYGKTGRSRDRHESLGGEDEMNGTMPSRHESSRRKKGASAECEQAAQGYPGTQTQTQTVLRQDLGEQLAQQGVPSTVVDERGQGGDWMVQRTPAVQSAGAYPASVLEQGHTPTTAADTRTRE